MLATGIIAFVARRLGAAALAIGIGISGFITAMPAAHAEVPQVRKVAMVDLQRVIHETKQGKNARKELERNSAAKQQQLDSRRKQLEANQLKLQTLTGEAQKTAIQKQQQDALELQGVYMALQQELAEQESRLLSQIYGNSQKIVAGLAQQMALDLVLVRNEETVLYTKSALDITDEIIARYDRQYPK